MVLGNGKPPYRASHQNSLVSFSQNRRNGPPLSQAHARVCWGYKCGWRSAHRVALRLRRGLIEEANAASASEFVLIDMAVMDFANAMRLQAVIGNTVLIIESEMFGQPTLRAKWKKQHGARPEDIQGLAVEEHVARLRDQLLPLVEKAQRLAREHLEAIGRMHRQPAVSIERAEAVNVVLIALEL